MLFPDLTEDRRIEIVADAAWSQILKKLGIKFEELASGVLVATCVFCNEEQTLQFFPGGDFKCEHSNCNFEGDMLEFVARRLGEWDEIFLADFFDNLPRWEHTAQQSLFKEA